MVKVFVFLFAIVLALTGVALDYSLAAKTHGGPYDFSAHVAARVAAAWQMVGLAPLTRAPSATLTADVAPLPPVAGGNAVPSAIAGAGASGTPGSGVAGLLVGGIIAGAHAATSASSVLAFADNVHIPMPSADASAGVAQGAAEATIASDSASVASGDDASAVIAPQSDNEFSQEGLTAAPSEGLPDDAATEASLGLPQQPVDATAGTDTSTPADTVTAEASGSHMIKPVSPLANTVCVMRAGVRNCGNGN